MKIAIITGGSTGEREISIRSALNMQTLIDFADTTLFTFPEETELFIQSAKEFDLAIPMIHGIGSEDGSLQGLLKNLNLPFLFSDISTHAIAIDKTFTKEIVSTLGILSPKEIETFPLFAKPRHGGSSVASKLCTSIEELNELRKTNLDTEFITEEPLKGREFTVGVIDTEADTIPLPVLEIIPKGEFFDFENKYNPEKLATEICPAQIDDVLTKELQRQALLVHAHLKARHLSRSDFIVTDDHKIYFLEINTIPGMTDTSLIPKMIVTKGLSIRELFKEWCGFIFPL
jgi:D-alanine-D-alanine ligase